MMNRRIQTIGIMTIGLASLGALSLLGILNYRSTPIQIVQGNVAIHPVIKSDAFVTIVGHAPLTSPQIHTTDPSLGNADAPVTIVLYSDMSCASCRDLDLTVQKIVRSSQNKVRLIWKDNPNERLYAGTMMLHRAARCAGAQGKFWEYHNAIENYFRAYNQNQLLALARDEDLDTAQFTQCMSSANSQAQALINANVREAIDLGLTEVPSLYINNFVLPGLTSTDDITDIIDYFLSGALAH